MYSALKINGKKLYELAREGKEVERKTREITIYSIDNLQIKSSLVEFDVVCSKGTYIRSLAYDLGKKCSSGAFLKEFNPHSYRRLSAEQRSFCRRNCCTTLT